MLVLLIDGIGTSSLSNLTSSQEALMQTITLMTTLADFTETALLVPQLAADHHEMAVAELVKHLESTGRLAEAKAFVDAVLTHDELAPTVFDGVAFPLARSETVRDLSFAVGRLPRPMHWGATREPLVDTVILIALPETEGAQYLSLIPAFSNFLKDPAGLAALRRCTQPEQMLEVFEQAGF
jgi:PTS system fructose-specific IIC component